MTEIENVWYAHFHDEQHGPYPDAGIIELLRSGQLGPRDYLVHVDQLDSGYKPVGETLFYQAYIKVQASAVREKSKPSIIAPAQSDEEKEVSTIVLTRPVAEEEKSTSKLVSPAEVGEQTVAPATQEGKWFTHIDGSETGPYTYSRITDLIRTGKLKPGDFIIHIDKKDDGYQPLEETNLYRKFIDSKNGGSSSPENQSNKQALNRTERGKIKWYSEIRGFGFVSVAGKPNDIFFHVNAFRADFAPTEGLEVDVVTVFDKVRNSFSAKDVSVVDASYRPIVMSETEVADFRQRSTDDLMQNSRRALHKRGCLNTWCNIKLRGKDNDLTNLVKLALEGEKWSFSYDPPGHFRVLEDYIVYTFYRLTLERKIVFSERFATFNTGLVNEQYDPIYALFSKIGSSRRYKFEEFCVPGIGLAGFRLVSDFPDLPDSAKYVTALNEVVFDHTCDISINWPHVILDAIKAGRYPVIFLRKHVPAKFDHSLFDAHPSSWLIQYATALVDDPDTLRDIRSRIERGISLAIKRSQWNYRTAIPNYYPTPNLMGLLLPIPLVEDSKPDIALVVNKVNIKNYHGVTVYPLDMAYSSARLVCRPDSNWLSTDVGESIATELGEERD